MSEVSRAALQIALKRLATAEANIQAAINDEADTQKKYQAWMNGLRELSQHDQSLLSMANTIEGIARQERDHQMRFQQMLVELTKVEGKIKTQLEEATRRDYEAWKKQDSPKRNGMNPKY